MMDCQLFDLRAGAHHLTNLLFHIANTLLLFAVLKRMSGALWRSAFVAGIFALHPLHVESVAWISERKDVLSTFFWMLTMWAYVRYTERQNAARYLLTLLFFALGLMAKPMLVTLPFVLLLLDYWPLGRLQRPVLHVVAEKLPFFAFSAVSSTITFFVGRSGGAMAPFEIFSVKTRIANTVVSYASYITDMLWPSRLAVLYPHPGSGIPTAKIIICVLGLLIISICFIYLGRRHRYLMVGWLWYLGTLIPVIGLVHVGAQARADRYTYIPLTGLFIIISWGLNDLLAKWRYRKIILGVLAMMVLSVLSICTHFQVRHWRNSITLCQHAMSVTEDNFIAYGGLGAELGQQGKYDEAIVYLTKALQIMPNYPAAHFNMGMILARRGKFNEAIEHFQQVLRIEPEDVETKKRLAATIENKRKTEELWNYYDKANSLMKEGKIDEAIEYYNKAIDLKKDFVLAHGRLALATVGKTNEAIKQCRIVLAARPDDVEMYCNLGILLEHRGEIAEAIKQYQKALQISPDNPKAQQLLQTAVKKQQNP
jgi:tetratricopeptide (TPR) repeat protein